MSSILTEHPKYHPKISSQSIVDLSGIVSLALLYLLSSAKIIQLSCSYDRMKYCGVVYTLYCEMVGALAV